MTVDQIEKIHNRLVVDLFYNNNVRNLFNINCLCVNDVTFKWNFVMSLVPKNLTFVY